MAGEFRRNGVHFQYPENWQLQNDSEAAAGQCLTLQSPGSGFWMLQELSVDQSPEKLVAEVLRSLRQDYDSVESNLVRERWEGFETVGYDLQFYCLDFLVSATVRSFVVDQRRFVVMCQAEDREFEEIGPVFRAITTSLFTGFSRAEPGDA